jgi:hypothetical protein
LIASQIVQIEHELIVSLQKTAADAAHLRKFVSLCALTVE